MGSTISKKAQKKIDEIKQRQKDMEDFNAKFELFAKPLLKQLGKSLEEFMDEKGMNKNKVNKVNNYAHHQLTKMLSGTNNPTIKTIFNFIVACKGNIEIESKNGEVIIKFK